MPIDVTDQYVRVRVRQPNEFKEGSFRTIIIQRSKGIKSVIGRLKTNDKSTNQNFMFEKSKGWTAASARKWVEDHGHKVV